MAVYVDDMEADYQPRPGGRTTYRMCHMIADTDEELRAMASNIGVQQKWHQGDHFDICKTKRRLAVTSGAIEITQRQCAAMRARRRETGKLGTPESALEWFRSRLTTVAVRSESTTTES